MLTFREISVADNETARQASRYPENAHELAFASQVEAVAAYYGGPTAGAVPHDRLPDRTLQELGLTRGQPISAEQRANMLLGRSSDGIRQLAKAKDRSVSGYDLTFSCDKSVSMLWALSDPAQRAKIELVVRRANERAMAIVQREIGKVRRGKAGSKGHDKVQLIYSSHAHYTARPTEAKDTPGAAIETVDAALAEGEIGGDADLLVRTRDATYFRFDPQMHCHNQVMSVAHAPDGKWLTLDTKLIHGVVHFCGTHFQAEIARGLREIGIETMEEKGAAVAVGFSAEIRQHFSARTFTAEQNAREYADRVLGEDFDSLSPERRAELMKAGSAATRLRKGREEDPDAHFAAWRAEAAAFGFTADVVRKFWSRLPFVERISKRRMIEESAAVALEKLAALLTREAIIDGRKFRDICAHAMVQFSTLRESDIEAVMRCAAEMPITVHGNPTQIRMFRNSDGDIRFTTEAQLAGEKRLLEICAASKSTHATDLALVERHFDPARPPNDGQRKAIEAIAQGGDITVIEGAAGVGKTTLLQAPIATYRRAGYDVIGLSIANRTAKALKDAGIREEKCLSIEAFVQAVEAGKLEIKPKTVVVIDEFSQVDIRRGTAVFDAVEAAGAKLVCLGDEFQAAAIDAGSAMRLSKSALERNVVEVTQTVRQSGEAAEIAAAFRKGGEGVAEAVHKKIANGDFIYVDGGREATVTAIVDKWVELGGLEGKCSISAPTNHDVMSISRGMRGKLRQAGRLDADRARLATVDVAGNETNIDLAVGDKVMLYKRTQGILDSGKRRDVGYNGSVVTLLDIDEAAATMRVKTATDTVFTIPFANLRDRDTGALMLGYGYALTIDKAQGITSDNHINALLGGTAAIDAKKFYVNESRHRHRCVTVLDRETELESLRRKLAIGVKLPSDPKDALVEYSIKNIERCALKLNAVDFVEAPDVEHLEAATFARALAKVTELPEEQARAAVANKQRAARTREQRFADKVVGELKAMVARVAAATAEIRDAIAEAFCKPKEAPKPAPAVEMAEADEFERRPGIDI
jgi:hypothetical protein